MGFHPLLYSFACLDCRERERKREVQVQRQLLTRILSLAAIRNDVLASSELESALILSLSLTHVSVATLRLEATASEFSQTLRR